MSINYIESQIIKLLYKQQNWITAEVISKQLDISIRSIKLYVSKIDQNTEWIISSRKGYQINPEFRSEILNHFNINNFQFFYESSKYRHEYILKKLITSSEGYDVFELSESMFISTSTLKADLKKLVPLLNEHELALVFSNNIYSIRGTEKNKRILISSILIKESQMGFTLEDVAEELIRANELEVIKKTLNKCLQKYSYYVNDYALFNLTTSLIIVVYRIRHQCTLTNIPHDKSLEETNEYVISREIFHSLRDQLDIDFSEEEILDFSFLIESHSLPVHYNDVNEANLLAIVSPEVLELVHEIITSVNKTYYIDLNISSFYLKFALHIQNLLLRAKIRQFCMNPLTQSIKESCPFIYEISVFIANLIDEKENIILDENEIAYIALHIGCIFKTENPGDKLTVLLISPDYYDLTTQLYSKINEKFKDSIFIVNTLHDKEELTKYFPCDFILSTIDLPLINNIPVIKIGIIPTGQDWNNISVVIQNLITAKNQTHIRNILSPLFNKKIFMNNSSWSNRSDVIRNICRIMAEAGYVEPDYEKFVIARESISSTAFGNIAIPHSLNPKGNKTGIFVSIHKKPIEWGEQFVSLVLLLSVNPKDQRYFSDIINKLTEILSSQDNIIKLTKCKNFDEFLDILTKLS